MAEDNVVSMPTTSERLVIRAKQAMQQYNDALINTEKGQRGALLAVIEYGKVLLEGRDANKSDQAFGKWISDNGLDQGKPWADNKERSNAMAIAKIGLGSETYTAFDGCLLAVPTNIMSWYRKRHPEKVRAKKPLGKAKQREKALDAIETLKATGAAVTVEAISKLAGVSNGAAGEAYAVHFKMQEAAATAVAETKAVISEAQALAGTEFTDKQKLRIEDAIRIHKTRLDKQFEQRVGDEVRRRIVAADDATRKQNAELRRENITLKQLIGGRGVFTQTEFRQLQMCVHPDNTASVEVRNRILDILVKNERRLIVTG